MSYKRSDSEKRHPILEVCTDSLASVYAAKDGGADRIELCSNLIIGGTTPSPLLFKQIKKRVRVPIRVLIRPRFGDFCYTDEEFEIMKGEVEMFRNLGASAVVIGILTAKGDLHIPRMRELVNAAGNMDITLHRAFDVCRNPFETLEVAKELGIGTILTSGQQSSYVYGSDLIQELIERSDDDLIIMPGGGMTPENLEQMAPVLKAKAYHMTGKVMVNSKMRYRNENVPFGLPGFNEFAIWQTDQETVSQARKILDNIDLQN